MTLREPSPSTHGPHLARILCFLSFVVGLVACASGCNRSPYPPGAAGWQLPPPGQYPATANMPATGPQSVFAQQQTSPQLIEQQRRMQQLDSDNRQLTSQVAQLQQQAQALQDQKELLAKQLQDSVVQNKQLLAASQQYADQARGMQTSMNLRGGARLTSNNSLSGSASGIQIAGARVVPDGELIRIRLPSDQLFSPGTAQLSSAGAAMLDQVAGVLTAQFSRQRVAIEGHTDTGQLYGANQFGAAQSGAQPYGGGGAPYRLAGEQAQAVMDLLANRNRVPPQQMFTVAHGPNHPIADNQSAAGRAENRRLEIVIYPDTF